MYQSKDFQGFLMCFCFSRINCLQDIEEGF